MITTAYTTPPPKPGKVVIVQPELAWTREYVPDFGGDPRHIVLAGQSAGAAHVASFVAGHGGACVDALAGAVMLSGIDDPPTAEQNAMLEAYFGDDPTTYADRSSVTGLGASDLPMLFGVAELDLPDFHRQAVVLLDAMRQEHGVLPPFVTVPDHTHLSEILALGLDDDAFGSVLARFVHRATAVNGQPVARRADLPTG